MYPRAAGCDVIQRRTIGIADTSAQRSNPRCFGIIDQPSEVPHVMVETEISDIPLDTHHPIAIELPIVAGRPPAGEARAGKVFFARDTTRRIETMGSLSADA